MNEIKRIDLFLNQFRTSKEGWLKDLMKEFYPYYYQKKINELVKLGKHPHPEESLSLVDK